MKTVFEFQGRVEVQEGAVVGLAHRPDCGPAVVGPDSIVRAGTIIYADNLMGDHFQTGHGAMVREGCVMGRYVLVGTHTVIDGQTSVGDFVKIESNCYIPTRTAIGSRVFIGPGVTMTNDKYPLKDRDAYRPRGPVIEDLVTIGGGCVLLPGVVVGRGSFIAAGAVVTRDVPPMTLVKGNPGRHCDLPEKLREPNMALNWRSIVKD